MPDIAVIKVAGRTINVRSGRVGPQGPPGIAGIGDVTQAEFDAALTLKQDAATAATDQELSDGLASKQSTSEKAQANGYASLDASAKVPLAQLTVGSMVYKGTWDATANTPTLIDGTGTTGDTYRVSVAGSRNLGSGSITYAIADFVLYNGTIWQKVGGSAAGISQGELDTAIATRQASDTELTLIAGLTAAADKGIVFTGPSSAALYGLSAFMRTYLLPSADAAAARTQLGLGTASPLNVPASGDAASGEVVKGSDSRLTRALPINPYTGNWTLAAADLDALAKMSSASDLSFIVPAASTYAPPVGRTAYIMRYGDGEVTITPAPGVTIRYDGGKVTGKYLDDALTGSDGAAVTSHAATIGGTWANASGSGSGALIKTNRAHSPTSGRRLIVPVVPESADYDVETVLYCATDNGAGSQTGPALRHDTGATTLYRAGWDCANNDIRLNKVISGGAAQPVGTSIAYPPGSHVGESCKVRLSARGTQLTLTARALDDTLIGSPMTATDSSITAAGRIGMSLAASEATPTGVHVDSIVAAPDLDYVDGIPSLQWNGMVALTALGTNEFYLSGGFTVP